MVAQALVWPILWVSKVRPLLVDKSIGIYNVTFDISMMQQSFVAYNHLWRDKLETFDILKIYARFAGEWDTKRRSYRFHSLENAGKRCQIYLPNAHRAVADALLAREVLHYMANQNT